MSSQASDTVESIQSPLLTRGNETKETSPDKISVGVTRLIQNESDKEALTPKGADSIIQSSGSPRLSQFSRQKDKDAVPLTPKRITESTNTIKSASRNNRTPIMAMNQQQKDMATKTEKIQSSVVKEIDLKKVTPELPIKEAETAANLDINVNSSSTTSGKGDSSNSRRRQFSRPAALHKEINSVRRASGNKSMAAGTTDTSQKLQSSLTVVKPSTGTKEELKKQQTSPAVTRSNAPTKM